MKDSIVPDAQAAWMGMVSRTRWPGTRVEDFDLSIRITSLDLCHDDYCRLRLFEQPVTVREFP